MTTSTGNKFEIVFYVDNTRLILCHWHCTLAWLRRGTQAYLNSIQVFAHLMLLHAKVCSGCRSVRSISWTNFDCFTIIKNTILVQKITISCSYGLVKSQSDFHGMIGLEAHAMQYIPGAPCTRGAMGTLIDDFRSHHSETAFHCRPDMSTWSMD